MASFPPAGTDRADGTLFIGGLPVGTATPPGARVVKTENTNGTFFEEDPGSPEIERGEQATIVHRFNTDPASGLSIIQSISRGTIFQDSDGNLTRCLTNRYQYKKGDIVGIEITSEGLSFDVPPDEYSLETIELNPSIFRHPRYVGLSVYTPSSGVNVGKNLGPQVITAIQQAADHPQLDARNANQTYFQGLFVLTDTINGLNALNLAVELSNAVRNGEDTFYLPGYKISYSVYAYVPWFKNPGGYIEDPVVSGNLPPYFWSSDGTSGGLNTITYLAALVAPQFYSNGLSWLRQADTELYQRTWFKLTLTWLGAPFGHWDTNIYNAQLVPPVSYLSTT